MTLGKGFCSLAWPILGLIIGSTVTFLYNFFPRNLFGGIHNFLNPSHLRAHINKGARTSGTWHELCPKLPNSLPLASRFLATNEKPKPGYGMDGEGKDAFGGVIEPGVCRRQPRRRHRPKECSDMKRAISSGWPIFFGPTTSIRIKSELNVSKMSF